MRKALWKVFFFVRSVAKGGESRERFQKCEFELLKCENIMSFFR